MKQKKFFVLIIAMIFFAIFIFNTYAQNIKYTGLYIFKSKFYYESILLSPNGHFEYKHEEEFLKINVVGNWLVRDSSLVLDSYPQKDRLLVFEDYKKNNRDKIVLHVLDIDGYPMTYHLTYLNAKLDTITLRDQWENSTIKGKVVSFFIVNTAGITSPMYKIKGSSSNYIKVLFEQNRVFENEDWIIKTNSLIPRGLNSKFQNHILLKN